jgi:xylulokinase
MAIVGLDIGSTGIKCCVYSLEGAAESAAYQEYSAGGYDGIPPAVIRDCARKVFFDAITQYGRKDISAVCATSFGESFVVLDARGEPVSNILPYTDHRGQAELDSLLSRVGGGEIVGITGVAPHNTYSLPKLLYMIGKNPDINRAGNRLMFIADYVLHLLGAEHMTDVSLASRSMLFDVHKLCWSEKLLKITGIERTLLPQAVPTGSVIGALSREIASELGLSETVKLVIGGHDQVANAIGAGVFTPGRAVNGIGTVDCITPVFREESGSPMMAQNNYATVPYLKSGNCVTYAYNFSGGAVQKWYRDMLAPDI